MRFGTALAAGIFIILAGVPAIAHHSVTGQFDAEKRQTWTGVITSIDWVNPHIYIHLGVVGEDGVLTTWQMETAPPAMMRKAGLTSEKVQGGGQEVTIDGIPGHDPSLNIGFIYKITYADGHYYQLSPAR